MSVMAYTTTTQNLAEAKLTQPTAELNYVLELYVGRNAASAKLVNGLKLIFKGYSSRNYKLDVIDVWDDPERVEAARIVATPTLIIQYPLPTRRIVGEVSTVQTLRELLGLAFISAG